MLCNKHDCLKLLPQDLQNTPFILYQAKPIAIIKKETQKTQLNTDYMATALKLNEYHSCNIKFLSV